MLLFCSLMLCVFEARKLLERKQALAEGKRRIETYAYQMEMDKLIRSDEFRLRGIFDGHGVVSRTSARRIYDARSSIDEAWDEKQLLTLMLVRVERLAAAYYLGIFDEDLFFATSGRYLVVTLRRLRFFIEVLHEDRPGTFATFVLVAKHMEHITEAREAGTEVVPLHRIEGIGGINR